MDANPGVPGKPVLIQGNDFVDGGVGEDSAGYGWSDRGVSLSFNGGSGAGGTDLFGGIDRLYGSQFDDQIQGTSGTEDWIFALDGNDRIEVWGDPNDQWGDHVDCGDGNDRSYGDGSPPNSGIVRDGLSGNCESRYLEGDGH